MPKYQDVVDAPIGKLKTAVDDWAEMATRLEKLAEEARDGMQAKSDKADWAGVNASVTQPFIRETAKEFGDAAAQAKGIKLLLEGAYAVFKRARDELVGIRDDEGPKAGIHIDTNGKVRPRQPIDVDRAVRHGDGYPAALKKQNENVAAWQKKIDQIVERCDDADESLRRALAANVTDDHNFTAPRFNSLDQEEAARAASLAKKGASLTHAELAQLNELLRENHRSQDFARSFYDSIEPKGALEFFGQLAEGTVDFNKVDKERLKEVQELQKNLGLNLANATQGADKWSVEWSSEMRKLGTDRIALGKNDLTGPFGYQLLGGIIRYGDYNPKFLNPIAEHVVQLHAKNPHMFSVSKPFAEYNEHPFNPSGVNGAGYDPVISVLEALGHSPEASKQFFSSPPTAYNEDGTVKAGFPEGKDKNQIVGYLDYFANEEYESFPDLSANYSDDATEKAKQYMPDALGHALEAATLGHAWDDPQPKLTRDETSAGIMEEVVSLYGADAGLLKHQEAMADSLGTMGAGYIDDINWALNKNHEDSVFAPAKGPDGTMDPSKDGHAEFGRHNVRGFLSTLGQHPDAYASVSTAERVYTTSALEAQVGPGGSIDQGAARYAVRTGAEVQGMLDQSRADQVEAEGMKKHEEYEKAHEKKSAWIEFGTTAAVAAGVAFFPATAAAAGAAAIVVPLAVDVGSGAVEQVAGQVIGDWSDKSLEGHKDKTEDQIREDKTSLFRAGEYSAEAPTERFIEYHRASIDSTFEQDLRESMNLGYANGNLKQSQQGNDPEGG
ncbi:hypothetical protein OHA27_00370 [Streptomyces sp. NBC_01619]|uniref:hypothetical protein n=1 Tax=Streptomyces sp. NBC_01619 TaxID=2975901 RepID=UPI00225B2A1E|nr:hypothetical protein [Streptomyces sp. NBC_01619]MCX4508779.1 hypothetical protein [Streptomyces sp. NBC_01619]